MTKNILRMAMCAMVVEAVSAVWAADVHVKSGEVAEINPAGWQAKATLWLDASKTETMTSLKSTWSNEWSRTETSKGYELLADGQVMEWRDVRLNGYKFRSTACTAALFDAGAGGTAVKIVPVLTERDGRKAIELPANDKCRMMLGSTSSSSYDMVVKCGVCVFNACLGGGYALLYDSNKYFSRATSSDPYPQASDPLLAGNVGGLSLRLGGEKVTSPTATGYSNGWQVVSFTRGGATITVAGLGQAFGASTGGQNGGQVYGEIILFADLLTETEMRQVESYLARKWNLPVAHAEPEAKAEMGFYGAGRITLNTNASATNGVFSGIIDLNGKRLDLPAEKFPYSAATVPSEGRALWLDPSLAAAVTMTDDPAKPLELASLASRDNNGVETGEGTLRATSPIGSAGASDFRVSVIQTNRTGVADADVWLEFDHTRYADGQKNNLMLVDSTAETPTTFTSADWKSVAGVKSAFMALDTTLGGGSQLLTRYSGETGFAKRDEPKASPILSASSDAGVKAASVWLDGNLVDGLTDHFSYRPEIMSLVIPENEEGAAVKQFGYTGYNSGNREIMGEILLYTTTVDAETRGAIEAYLMNKWLGKLPGGYADFRSATITGGGVLAVEGPEYLPQLDAGFVGTVSYSRTVWNTALGATSCVVDLAGHLVELPATVTVNVDVNKAPSGTYPVFRTGGLVGCPTFVIGTVTGRGTARLVVDGSTVSVRFDKTGMVLLVK